MEERRSWKKVGATGQVCLQTFLPIVASLVPLREKGGRVLYCWCQLLYHISTGNFRYVVSYIHVNHIFSWFLSHLPIPSITSQQYRIIGHFISQLFSYFAQYCLLSGFLYMWACSIAHFNFLVLLMFLPRWKPSCQVVPVWTNRRPLVEPASAKAPASPAGPQHTLRIALLVLFILMLALWALSY